MTGAGATAAATQAANTLQTVMAQNTERLKIAADLFLATQGAGQGDADKAKASPTAAGLAMTTADRQDKAAAQAAGSSGRAGGAADPSLSLEQQAQAAQTGATVATATQQAIDTAVAGAADDAAAKPAAPTPAQRRGGRRVQPTAAPPLGGGFGKTIADAFAAALSDVPFSLQFVDAPGAKLPKGQRRLRIVDDNGRTVLSVSTQGDVIDGVRPASDKPVTYQVELGNDSPAFTLTTQRRMVPPQAGNQRKEILQVRPVLAKREALVPPADVPLLLLASEAELLARPEVQAFAAELPRRASTPRLDVRGGQVFIVFSVFAPELANRQVVL